MDCISNYKNVMKNIFNKEDITEKEAKKNLNNKQKTVITNSTLIEHRVEEGMIFNLVTDLVTEESHVYAPRGKVKKNEELNLISGITSLGLFDSDNVYCGQLDPNNTGIRKPLEIEPDPDKDKKDKEEKDKKYIESDFEVKEGDEYETIFGLMRVESVDGNKDMTVVDSNNVQMFVSFDDFIKLNPIKTNAEKKQEQPVDTDKKIVDMYRVLFKTIEPDGSVKEWCMTFEEEEEMNKEIESIKQNPSLIEITNILNPNEVLSKELTEPEEVGDMNQNEEGGSEGGMGGGFGEGGGGFGGSDFGNEVDFGGGGEGENMEGAGGGIDLGGGEEPTGGGEESFGGGEAPSSGQEEQPSSSNFSLNF